MNKYKQLIQNTLVFAAGTFGSKILVFLLMPFYTRMLTPDQYGVVDIIVNTANLIVPIVTLSISDAIIRFALDKAVNKSDVFSSGLLTVLCGYAVFLCLTPLMAQFDMISPYLFILYFYVFASSVNGVCGQFVRSSISPRLFAWAGFQNTVIVVVLNLLFLWAFRMGINGYVLSIAIADLVTALFLVFKAKLYRFIKFRHLSKSVLRGMVVFAVPLIPNSLFWWITSVSDRYIVTALLGEYANGLYAAAYKIPTFVALISSIFTQAWQLSAITEYNAEGRTTFYRRVFGMYETVVFLAAAVIVVFIKPLTAILVAPSYYESWQYIPYLLLAFVFQCLSGFWASIYMAAKRNLSVMITTLLGAGANIVLNFLLIPIYGANGAAFATFISYFAVFIFRAIYARRFIQVRINIRKITVNFLIVLGQCIIMICQPPLWPLYVSLLLALILFLNSLVIKSAVKSLLKHRRTQPN